MPVGFHQCSVQQLSLAIHDARSSFVLNLSPKGQFAVCCSLSLSLDVTRVSVTDSLRTRHFVFD
jgi:hypothetical protein